MAMAITNSHINCSATQHGSLRFASARPAFGCIEPQRTRRRQNAKLCFHHLDPGATPTSTRDLLARKTDIERRIAQSIQGLEKAMGTTFREFEVVLDSRTQLLKSTNAPADASAASTALILKPLK
jgi:hypothetical protein